MDQQLRQFGLSVVITLAVVTVIVSLLITTVKVQREKQHTHRTFVATCIDDDNIIVQINDDIACLPD